jgi:hypothetical protein
MSGWLAAIGRANPANSLKDVINTKMALDAQQSNELLRMKQMEHADFNMQWATKDNERKAAEFDYKMGQEKKLDAPQDVGVLLDTYAVGGRNSEVAKIMLGFGKGLGMVDESTGDMGTVSMRNVQKLLELAEKDPQVSQKISLATINHYRTERARLAEEFAKHPQKQELAAQLAEVDLGLQTSLGANKALMDKMKLDSEIEARKAATEKARDDSRVAQNYLLSDKTMVISTDGGKTYKTPDGSMAPMPHDAVKVSATITGQELAMFRAQAQAEGEETPSGNQPRLSDDMQKKAESGTGPYSMLKASIDKLFGGIAINEIFGSEGFFQDTQENRQVLRTIKQLGKAALMNSARGAVWEQERIDELFPDPDKLFVNPKTEAKKFKVIREALLETKYFNNEAIKRGTMPSEVSQLRNSNTEIDRLLALIGGPDHTPAGFSLSPEDQALLDKYSK